MRYIYDNDLHIHSRLSVCSRDPEQSPERILQYAKDNGLTTVCLTDHFWDPAVPNPSKFYEVQDFDHVTKALPLPQAEGIRYLFGCETELDKDLNLAITRETVDKFDFVIIPTTHFHMEGFTLYKKQCRSAKTRAEAWVRRLDAVLSMDLPFHKIGLAHLVCGLIAPTRRVCVKTVDLIPEFEMRRLFTKAAELGVGIELNSSDVNCTDKEMDIMLRPFRIAKECGCKFYFGSDAHHVKGLLEAKEIFERAIDRLGLTEEDKFILK